MATYDVPEALKSQLQLSGQELQDLKNAFSLFDAESKGTISNKDFESLTQTLGLRRQTSIDESYCKKPIHKNSDKLKGTDEVDFAQFLQMTVQRSRRRRNSYQLEAELREAFNNFDKGNKGYLTVADLKQVMLSLGDSTVTDDDVKEMMREADLSKDSHICFEEFRSMMTAE